MVVEFESKHSRGATIVDLLFQIVDLETKFILYFEFCDSRYLVNPAIVILAKGR